VWASNIEEVVDCDDVKLIPMELADRFKDLPPDATETINTDFYCHHKPPNWLGIKKCGRNPPHSISVIAQFAGWTVFFFKVPRRITQAIGKYY
jgi:hypothetical protein